MKNTPYLDFYYHCMKTGLMPTWGLCNKFKHCELFKLIDPEVGHNITYWGFELPWPKKAANPNYMDEVRFSFTPLRQTIVLFLAAMNNEL